MDVSLAPPGRPEPQHAFGHLVRFRVQARDATDEDEWKDRGCYPELSFSSTINDQRYGVQDSNGKEDDELGSPLSTLPSDQDLDEGERIERGRLSTSSSDESSNEEDERATVSTLSDVEGESEVEDFNLDGFEQEWFGFRDPDEEEDYEPGSMSTPSSGDRESEIENIIDLDELEQDILLNQPREGSPFHFDSEMRDRSPARRTEAVSPIPYSSSEGSETQYTKREARRNLEVDLIDESKGRLDPKLMDIGMDPSLPPVITEAFLDVRRQVVLEMSDRSTIIGKLVELISRRPKEQKYYVLRDSFARFASEVSARITNACPDHAGKLRSARKFIPLAEKVPYNRRWDRNGGVPDTFDKAPDIVVRSDDNEEHSHLDWHHGLTFGVVHLTRTADVRDFLLGQVMRYDSEHKTHHPITGRSHFFTLCGPLLQLWYTDAASFGTSASFDFADPADYAKLVDVVAFLSGPREQIHHYWKPRNGETLLVQNDANEESGAYSYVLSHVKLLASASQLWSRRTAVWSATVTAQGDHSLRAPNDTMSMVIKSSWLPVSHYRHELDVLRWIQDKGSTLKTDFVPNLPVPIGMVADPSGAWYTANGTRRNSTIATYCAPASHLDQVILSPREHLRVYRGLFQTLRYLAEVGVHYRDLNSGNVLRNGDGECLLIDLGNARILETPRGPKNHTHGNRMAISSDDSRSGTLTFLSRRIHRLALQMEVHREAIKRCDKAQLDLSTLDKRAAAERAARVVQKIERFLSDQTLHHRYIDDAESALYLMLFQASQGRKQYHELDNLSKKETFWDAGVTLAAPSALSTLEELIEQVQTEIDICQTDMIDALVENGQAHPLELACFSACITMMQEREAELDKGAAEKAARRRKRAAQALRAVKDKGKVKSEKAKVNPDKGKGKATKR